MHFTFDDDDLPLGEGIYKFSTAVEISVTDPEYIIEQYDKGLPISYDLYVSCLRRVMSDD